MFNFNLLNKAVCDVELSGSAFKMLYLIANKCSLENNNQVEIHNGWLMMIMNLKERQVQNLTKELVEKGYINKTIIGTSRNNKGNLYELTGADINAINDVKNYAKNCTLKNNIKIYNNNISKEIKENIYTNINTSIIKEKKENNKLDILNDPDCIDSNNNFNSIDSIFNVSETDVNELNNNNSSNEEFTNVPNIEYRNNERSDNPTLNEEIILIKDFNKNNNININFNKKGSDGSKHISSTYDFNCPPKNAPHSKEDNNNDNEIYDSVMKDLEVIESLKQILPQCANLMRENKDYNLGLTKLQEAFADFESNGWLRNEDLVRKYIELYEYSIEDDLKEIDNANKNENKAVPDAPNGSGDKSIIGENKINQGANKGQNLAIDGTPIEEVSAMVLKQAILISLKEDYESGLEEINRFIQSLKKRGYEATEITDKLLQDYNKKHKRENKVA